MSSDDFDEPQSAPTGDRVKMEIFVNKLVIVRPTNYREDLVTMHKPNGGEAVFANVALLDPYEGEPYKVFYGVLIMQGYLIGAFKGSLNKNLLGTIYEGPATKGKPPYMFRSLTDKPQILARGKEWLDAHGHELRNRPEGFDDATPSAETQRQKQQANPYMLNNDEPPF